MHGKFTSNNTILTLSAQYVRVGKLAEGLTKEMEIIDTIRPQEDVKISLSAGILGFRHTKQGEYEAGFQTTARMFALINERGYFKNAQKSYNRSRSFGQQGVGLEIMLCEFGKGRDAFINVLNGSEGNNIRRHVTRVTDNTRIKIGGSRPPRARRV